MSEANTSTMSSSLLMDDRNVISPIRKLEEQRKMFSVKIQSGVLIASVVTFIAAGAISFVNASSDSEQKENAALLAVNQANLREIAGIVRDAIDTRSGIIDTVSLKQSQNEVSKAGDHLAKVAPGYEAKQAVELFQKLDFFLQASTKFEEYTSNTFKAHVAATSATEVYEALQEDLAGRGSEALNSAISEALSTSMLIKTIVTSQATDRAINPNTLADAEVLVRRLDSLNSKIGPMLSGAAAETFAEGDKYFEGLRVTVRKLADRTLGDQVYASFAGGESIVYAADSMSYTLAKAADAISKNSGGVLRYLPYVFGGIGFLLIGLLMMIIMVRNRIDARIVRLEQKTTDDIIVRLMEEMTPVVADKNYGARLTVTEHVVGTVADSMNRMIEEVAEALTEVQTHAKDVSVNVQRSKASSDEIRNIMEESVIFSQSSADTAERGNKVVTEATELMNGFRTQIQDISKRLKKLGETTQTIGSVVGTVREIAEKTGILALNASLKATEAGEAGRPFVLIAGEIQKLSESVKESLKDITSSAQAIQGDTNVAISTMETVTQSVVEGSAQWVKATEALDEITELSRQLQDIIKQAEGLVGKQTEIADESSASITRLMDTTEQFKLEPEVISD